MAKDIKPNLSYLAGFFDGEGTIQIAKQSGGLLIQVAQCNRWILELFRMQFGGSIHEVIKPKPYTNIYMWSIAALKASSFLETIKPYLTLKKPEAILAIEYQKRRRPKGKNGKPASQKVFEEAQRILLKKLKQDVKQF